MNKEQNATTPELPYVTPQRICEQAAVGANVNGAVNISQGVGPILRIEFSTLDGSS